MRGERYEKRDSKASADFARSGCDRIGLCRLVWLAWGSDGRDASGVACRRPGASARRSVATACSAHRAADRMRQRRLPRQPLGRGRLRRVPRRSRGKALRARTGFRRRALDHHRRRRLRGGGAGERRAERYGVAGARNLDSRHGRFWRRPAHGPTGRPEPLGVLEGALEDPDPPGVRLKPSCRTTGWLLLNLAQSRLRVAFWVLSRSAPPGLLSCIATLDE